MEDMTIRFVTPPDPYDDAKTVRIDVFQMEQGIAGELDFDGNDDSATHIIVYHMEKPVGTGRIRHIEEDTVKIERIAVIREMRKKGIGKRIMESIDEHLSQNGIRQAILDSQHHAKGFYENQGFEQVGEVFEEVGIPHVVMKKSYHN